MTYIQKAKWLYDETTAALLVLLSVFAREVSNSQQTLRRRLESVPWTYACLTLESRLRSVQYQELQDNGLKKCLLDSLAELLARKQRGAFVSSDFLVETAEGATVFATRNEGFDPSDYKFFEDFSTSVASISEHSTKEKEDQLLLLMLKFYAESIAFHAHELRLYCQHLERKIGCWTHEQNGHLRQLESLLAHCNEFYKNPDRNIEIADKLTAGALMLSESRDLKKSLVMSYNGDASITTVEKLSFLALIRDIHNTVVTSAKTFPSFQRFRINGVNLTQDQRGTHVSIGTAYQKLEHVTRAAWHVLGFNEGLLRQIEASYTKKLIIHAEMQILFFLLRPENAELTPFPYLGISMRPCYKCKFLLAKHGLFETRPSHGKMCPSWTLPRLQAIAIQHKRWLCAAVANLNYDLCDFIFNLTRRKLSTWPESAVASPWRSSRVPNQPELRSPDLRVRTSAN